MRGMSFTARKSLLFIQCDFFAGQYLYQYHNRFRRNSHQQDLERLQSRATEAMVPSRILRLTVRTNLHLFRIVAQLHPPNSALQ